MKKCFFISALVMLFAELPIYSQVNMSDMDLASTDSLQKSRIRYFSPGNGGRGKVWDFSGKLSSKESSQVKFLKDSTGVVSVLEPGKISYYRTTPDTLILFGSESPLEKREYNQEKVTQIISIEYGDSVIMPFKCEGLYCGNHPFREVGTSIIKVDADGSIILRENEHVDNVRRIHIIDSYSICMDTDSAALDTAKLTQVIDERYEWYLANSQYPIIESVTSTTYFNMDVIGTTKYAYCNLPEDQADNYITPEDENRPDDTVDEELPNSDIFHYNMETNGKTVQITYNLDEDAVITTIVANHMGLLCVNKKWTQAAGQGYSVQIDCNGLRPGIYILYINVNGKVYSEKVTL
jgi:hypothetical protein